MSQIGAPLAGSYDYGEVARSIFIAIAASYAALQSCSVHWMQELTVTF
jgi:hypothetical protein